MVVSHSNLREEKTLQNRNNKNRFSGHYGESKSRGAFSGGGYNEEIASIENGDGEKILVERSKKGVFLIEHSDNHSGRSVLLKNRGAIVGVIKSLTRLVTQ